MKFIIMHQTGHPNFSGGRTDFYEFELSDFINMENKFNELSKNIYDHVSVYLNTAPSSREKG